MSKKKVLFICIHNSARSQMAEELLRKYGGDKFEVTSAGIEPGKVNPFVVEVLRANEGIDIADKETQKAADLAAAGNRYDYIVTVCDETAAERCPVFPGGGRRLHWGFRDPSAFEGTTEAKHAFTEEILGEIKAKINAWLKEDT